MNLRLHKIALISLATLSMLYASADNIPVEQPEIVVQEESIPEKLLNIYRSLIQKCAHLTAENTELQKLLEEQHYTHLHEIDDLEQKLIALKEAYERILRENEELRAENDLLKQN